MFMSPAVAQMVRIGGPLLLVVWLAGFALGFETSLGIVSALAMLAAVAGFKYPTLGVVGVSVLCSIDGLMRFFLMSGGWLRWNTLNYLFLLAVALCFKTTKKLTDTHTKILALLVFQMALQMLVTPDPETGMHTMLSVVSSFGILVFFVQGLRDLSVLQGAAILNGIVGAGGGAVFYYYISSLPRMNNNAWSAFPITVLFSICLGYAQSPARLQMWLGVLATINLAWLFLTGSRGAMLVAIFLIIYLFTMTRRNSLRIGMALVAPVLMVIAFTVFSEVTDYATARLTKLFDDSRSMGNRTSGRSDLVMAGVHVFQNYPLGVGTGGFGHAFAGLIDVGYGQGKETMNAHSAWIKILAENGILGILVMGAYVLSFAARSRKYPEHNARALGLLVTCALAAMFITREFQSKSIWFIGAAYIATMCPEYKKLRGPEQRQPRLLPPSSIRRTS
jgi:O-antigen ligase